MVTQVDIFGMQFSTLVRSVQLCCEELGIQYTLGMNVNEQTIGFKSPEHLALNPFGKIPVLLHQGHAIYESQVICRYLDNNSDGALQLQQLQQPWQKIEVEQWCSAISTHIDSCIVRQYLLEFLFPKGENGSVRSEVVQAATPAVIGCIKILEQQLGNNDYLVANRYSLADILLTPMLHYLLGNPNNLTLVDEHSSLRAYVARILARPAAKNVFI